MYTFIPEYCNNNNNKCGLNHQDHLYTGWLAYNHVSENLILNQECSQKYKNNENIHANNTK